MSEWFTDIENENVTHFCGGVPTNEEVIDRFTEQGVFGNIKHKDTNTKLSMWFYPVILKDGKHECQACGKVKPDDVEFIRVEDPV